MPSVQGGYRECGWLGEDGSRLQEAEGSYAVSPHPDKPCFLKNPGLNLRLRLWSVFFEIYH